MRRIETLVPLPRRELFRLIGESEEEGFAFLRRLISDYDAGIECFDRPGEILLGVFEGMTLIAIGGITRDPYASDRRTGRVRHLYVAERNRGKGIGRELVNALIDHGRRHFEVLTVRTEHPASGFYEVLGFEPVNSPSATHRLPLDKPPSET